MGCGCRGNSTSQPSNSPKPVSKPSNGGNNGTPGTPVANPRTVQTVRRTIIRK